MSAATTLSEAYGEGVCLYETVLEVTKEATASQLRKAYYKKCLKYHPDKLSANLSNEDKNIAKKKFAAISLAYDVLSDEKKRKEYDESGELVDDDDDDLMNKSGTEHWMRYFNNVFPKVTTSDIDAFEVKYKCSDEEEADVLKYYTQFKGDLNKMLECVMLSSDVDKGRWVKDFIDPAIKSGEIENYSTKLKATLATPTKKRKPKGKKGTKPNAEDVNFMDEDDDYEDGIPIAELVVEGHGGSKKTSSTKKSSKKKPTKKRQSQAKAPLPSRKKQSSAQDSLIAQIRGKSSGRSGFDSMMAGLEARYGDKKKKGGKHDIGDEEFAAIQAKLMANKKVR